MAVVHLPSKLRWSDDSQSQYCPEVAAKIRLIEKERGHMRTLVVGDLNMNPFEPGLVSSAGFNATMSRKIASRGRRILHGRDCFFFYNPMWALFGDARKVSSGTYYYNNSQPVTYYWNIFDQILLRPSLLEYFQDESLAILEGAGRSSFLTNRGQPDKGSFSDHLPLLFSLDLETKG